MTHHGQVNIAGVFYSYIYHWGGKTVMASGFACELFWSTRAGNFEECPAIVRQAIQADITAKEVERCIQGA